MTFALSFKEMEEIQGRFKALRLENEGLKLELETANQALKVAMGQLKMLREALEQISRGTPATVHEATIITLAKKTLSQITQAGLTGGCQ